MALIYKIKIDQGQLQNFSVRERECERKEKIVLFTVSVALSDIVVRFWLSDFHSTSQLGAELVSAPSVNLFKAKYTIPVKQTI